MSHGKRQERRVDKKMKKSDNFCISISFSRILWGSSEQRAVMKLKPNRLFIIGSKTHFACDLLFEWPLNSIIKIAQIQYLSKQASVKCTLEEIDI